MAVDPYSPCPCGSGQKFKWCCHKVEAYADRSLRLYEGGQIELALQTLEDGLKKEPGNAWLLTRKALILTRAERPDEAKVTLREVLRRSPEHLGAHILMTRLVLETEGPAEGAAQLQLALNAFPPGARPALASLARAVGAFLAESGDYPAAIRHLELASAMSGGADESNADGLAPILNSPAVSPWLKNQESLSPAPGGFSGEASERFSQALGWAEAGLWSSAAAAFETLTDDPVAGLAAERNLGFCRLWLADDEAAAAALRRYARRLGPTEEAVDVEALCQRIAPLGPEDLVEHVQLIWPLRDRQALIDALSGDAAVHTEEPEPIDPADPESPVADTFALLDQPRLKPGGAESVPDFERVPRVVARAFVGQEIAILEANDDGRLDVLAARFTTLAGPSLAPAHPKTKVLGKVPRVQLALSWEWILPDKTDPAVANRLNGEFGARLIRDVWTTTPMGFLGGRTPLQAAQEGDAEVPLRAAVMALEQSREPWSEGFDFAALRERLHIPAEPAIDPATVNPATLHLSRLASVPADRLGDEALVALYARARRTGSTTALESAARLLTTRPEALGHAGVSWVTLYSDLATLAAAREGRDEALDWVRRGRSEEKAVTRARNAAHWDMLELRLKAQFDAPESWVAELSVILDRYSADTAATELIMMNLVDMGLIQVAPNPDSPGEILLDTRRLQTILAKFGPRVTTASGRLGVSAVKPEIWTPAGEAGSSGGIWTPGSSPAPAGQGEGKKIIITG